MTTAVATYYNYGSGAKWGIGIGSLVGIVLLGALGFFGLKKLARSL
jgi:hypothetical protein